ncbi:MAG: protein kinase [Algicola sp.]|nr:protein kinase [Algicola sp.]
MNKSNKERGIDIPNTPPTLLSNKTHLAQVDTVLIDNPEQSQANTPEPTKLDKRFKLLQPLGHGGCGSVFLAHDNQLQRKVAIKMLTHSLINQTLLAEARMQAKIEHPNICKIYQVEEADENNSNSYLVMQYIPGTSALKWLEQQERRGDTLQTEQIITSMQKVCDGLQAMHAQGIIHRDIKPDNIMFATDPENDLQPYMVDFGLANIDKDIKFPQSRTGIEGTPPFMSPEQWQNALLDCRSDVYSFGATLYQLLTGLAPHPACNNSHSPEQYDNPRWLRLPMDIRAIIRKCMLHEREKRYQSARELNSELKRFLTGEPVRCLSSKTYWLKKKLRKNKWQALLLFVLSVGGTSTGIWQQYQQHQQQVREQLLTRFTGRVENLEANVRLSKMAVSHDITLETKQWQQQIDTLKAEIARIGINAYGPGHYAIGRMYYSLQQYDKALRHLQKAWTSGFDQTRVAYNLALSHGAIYQRQKAIISNIRGGTARRDKMAILDKQHRQPAVSYLEQGMGDSLYLSYTKALIQYYQGEEDVALTTLAQTQDLPSWFYQHHVLRGDIYLAKTEKAGTTHDDERVQSHLKLALQHYATAAQQGRSDLQLQLKPLIVYSRLLKNSLYVKQRGFTDIYQQAMTTLDNATNIAPGHYQLYSNKGRLLSIKSDYQDQHGGDPLTSRQQAIEQFKQALTLSPDNPDILMTLGLAYSHKIKLLQERDLPIGQLFTRADNTFKRIPNTKRDYAFYNYYALLQHEMAVNKAGLLKVKQIEDVDADQYFVDAITSYQQAIQKKPKAIAAYLNMGVVFRDWSRWVKPKVARQKLLMAIEQYQLAQQFNAKHFVLNFNLAQSYNSLSQVNALLLQPLDEAIKMGKSFLTVAAASYPDHPFVVLESANLNTGQGMSDWQKGCPFEAWFDLAKSAVEGSLTANPKNAVLLDGRAWMYTTEQLLSYFASDATIVNLPEYHQALNVTKNIISKKHEQHMLLLLLDHKYNDIEQAALAALPPGGDASLAYAEWHSQSGHFEQAQDKFASIQRVFPAILWLYRQQHLTRWLNSLKVNPTNTKAIQQLNQEIAHFSGLLKQHFPAIELKKTNSTQSLQTCKL